ncbi:MAG TPA: glutamine-hydrolyzing carbamoyl-phosphate synthase small subunit [Armatimonadota bacterium]|nr:glutamine-hydrolyzing carbamoyl-phosphate synthase small subunit [Armatimonadota bacterium]HOM81508.1 glutamine-hydrolyzing carbamoyl-phosphate synthase small subunit [Armatimonadota bacterium]HPO74043.1 glutamine-hydrolyzing carbamoyl-phosphate synthase small subunit [Armatimonadota bacterium]HPT98811.1 glutamine-hydrolyzing carbamoyl-phosphate synthase small subunit [Armatimonadota bacterium]
MVKASLVLEDGTVWTGTAIGAAGRGYGEVVFNTSMTGYQEMLTDPSYAGQILTLTYPLIGNYGATEPDTESRRVQVSGLIVRELCETPSNWRSQGTLQEYLERNNVVGIQGIDTRALTRHLRVRGVMMGALSTGEDPEAMLAWLKALPDYTKIDFARRVTTPEPYTWEEPADAAAPEVRHHVVAIDCGLKYSILRSLRSLGCRVTVVPCTTTPAEILAHRPDGILLSPGPGNPALLGYLVDTIRALLGKLPILGICLGNQLVGCALGGSTFKLKFGHRGGNHPVKDLTTGRVYITSQNHGFALDPESLAGTGAEVTHVNLNDGTVEGIRHEGKGVFTVQYHPEASPGPWDNFYLFEQFVERMG